MNIVCVTQVFFNLFRIFNAFPGEATLNLNAFTAENKIILNAWNEIALRRFYFYKPCDNNCRRGLWSHQNLDHSHS